MNIKNIDKKVRSIIYFIIFTGLFSITSLSICKSQPVFQIDEKDYQVDILVDKKLFTSYRYSKDLLKPVLYPIYGTLQLQIQRQYPLKEVKGETHDHEHHVGLFFTYGSDGEVNNNSFWNKHTPPPRITHKKITKKEIQGNTAILGTRSDWVSKEGKILLVEDRTMKFIQRKGERVINFKFELQAQDEDVVFKDTKEGMFAVRVADWLSEEHGNGTYINAQGDTSSENVWGKRSKWVKLEGIHDGTTVGIAILNHPTSVHYPTFWHAREYGLFSANPLGQSSFQESRGINNPELLNYTISAGESGIFKFQVIIYDGHRSAKQIENRFDSYSLEGF